MRRQPSVTVIIPAYNEESAIGACIDALLKQDYKGSCEIIVVDNASSDETAAIAKARNVRVVYEGSKGYVQALMAGFGAASGAIIASTDADTLVPPDWLSRMVMRLNGKGVVAITGVFRFFDGPLWLRAIGAIFGRLNWQLAGANMAVWAWAYKKAGGFSRQVNMGADKELGLRLATFDRVVIDRGLVVATSSRRFESFFFKTIWTYFGNDLWLILFRKPAFFNFDDIRISRRVTIIQRPVLQFSALLLLFASFIWYAERTDNQMFGSVFAHGSKTEAMVALTFDDGPSPQTVQVLDTLDAYGVKATFFVIGKNVERHPEMVREILRRGHEIGNHTYTHRLLTALETQRTISDEIAKGSEAIEKATGQCPQLFRPPCGWRSPWMMKAVKELGYPTVTWDVDPSDWKRPSPRAIEESVCRHVHAGSVVLLHDGLQTFTDPGMDSTVMALPGLIKKLREKGFNLVTVSQLRGTWPVFSLLPPPDKHRKTSL
jgi:peptidoglycan/xylan/chitin deacetylase (PgdA/CDA1 family)